MALQGIDISHYQKGLDLSKVKPGFVIIKATEGVSMVDAQCDSFYQAAKRLGIPRGFYHFARPSKNTAKAEADYFVKNCKGYFKDGVPVLDWEDSVKTPSWAKKWLDEVYRQTGVRPLIYMSSSVVNSYDWSSVAGGYGLWVANYGVNNGQKNTKPSVKYWSTIAIWQYTSVGKLSGYSGNLDLDEFYGDAAAWARYANPGPSVAVSNSENTTADNNAVSSNAMYNYFLDVDNYEAGERKLIEHLGINGKKCAWGDASGSNTGGHLGSERRQNEALKTQLADTNVQVADLQERVDALTAAGEQDRAQIEAFEQTIIDKNKKIEQLELKLEAAETGFINRILKLSAGRERGDDTKVGV